jgi:dTDP-4-dehydrorhamnose reductase
MPVLRVAVIGKHGQVARALAEHGAAEPDVTLIRIGRPELDLRAHETIAGALEPLETSVIVNAAAYTAVDQAEEDPEAAAAVNSAGAGAVAEAARVLGVPLVHLSTDYVFDGEKTSPYAEEDWPAPTNAYGASKLAGEQRVCAASQDHVILRTAWVYAPYGKNFLRTMCALASAKDEVRVVHDQLGSPSYAPDIAIAIIRIARNLVEKPSEARLRGIFHLAGRGETNWAGFAGAIFDFLGAKGLRRPALIPITSADYPTRARRPANSRLDCAKIARVYGISLPPWRESLEACMERLITLEVRKC